jgi:hypothetical protein
MVGPGLPGRPISLKMTGNTMLPRTLMNRRRFLSLSTAAALCAAGPAYADYQGQVIRQLRKQGYRNIVVTSTLLGRLRITASRADGSREIVMNPRTGEILRDHVVVRGSGSSGPKIAGDDDNQGNGGGSGTDDGKDDDDDNGGSSGGDDSGGDDDSSGSDDGGNDDDSGSSGGGDDSEDNSGSDNSGGSDDGGSDDSSDDGGSDDDSEDDDSSDDDSEDDDSSDDD